MNRMLTIWSLVILLLIFSKSYADDSMKPDGKIKGAVAEMKSEKPVEYATVSLYHADNDEFITGVITDYLGHFKLDQPQAPGQYYLSISFIGFEEIKSEVFKVSSDRSNINLGNFFFEPSATELEGVEITAKVAAVEYRIDKKVINVDKQITAEAGTAIDVLETIPSVQVDVEGNVTLRGSSGFTVLIDGKPTILDASDVLRQIPSSSIEDIEIITNPSVKYEPDGAAGIINIITKKNRLDGLSGIANANVGTYGQYGGDFQLNYRLNKINLVFGANANQRTRPGEARSERTTFSNDTLFYLDSYGDSERGFNSKSVRAGIEYDVSKNDFISISGRYGSWDMNTNSILRYDDYTVPVSELFPYNSMENTDRGGTYYSIDGSYQHTFAKKVNPGDSLNEEAKDGMPGGGPGNKPTIKHTLNIEVNYRNRDFNESSTNELRKLTGDLIGGNRSSEYGPSESIRFNIDYTLPIGTTDKVEAGMQWRNGNSEDATELWIYDNITNELERNDDFSYLVDYRRSIYAAYGLYAGYLGSFGYQLGLRTEYTDRKIDMMEQDEFTIDRWDYFPTIHASYTLPSDQQIMASYSRRIDRPRSWWLEPFITWEDQYNVRQGNPALKPEYIDSYDAGYLKNFGNNSFSLEAYYRVTNNKVERISSVYEENVILRRPENIGQDFALGLEAMINIEVFKWWDMEISGNYYDYKLKGELSYEVGDEIIVEPINRNSTNWSSRFNNTFKLWENGVLQINSRYNSATVTAQGSSSDYYTLDAAFRVSFLDKALRFNLQGRDVLGTSMRETFSEGPGFYSHYKYNPQSPTVALTVSYRFNNYKASRRTSQGGGDTDDL